MAISETELQFVQEAAKYLEAPSVVMKTVNQLGRPVEVVTRRLPKKFHSLVQASLSTGMRWVSGTVNNEPAQKSGLPGRMAGWAHTAAAAVTGAAGGAFGLAALALELPLTTAVILRSVADIARDCGEDVGLHETRLECLTVLAHGGPSEKQKAMESTYYAARISMAAMVSDAVQYLARMSAQQLAREIAAGTAPPVVRLLSQIGARFGVVAGQMALVQAVPVVGAVTGAAINAAFTDHFNQIARYHFGLRKLERRHGAEAVREAYQLAMEKPRPLPEQGA